MKRRIQIFHTGGTLGMTGEVLEPGAFGAHLLDHVPELARLADVDVQVVCNLDSSDVGPDQWKQLAAAIEDASDQRDGFVIVHGTDTLSYTAAALSFALEGLRAPVVLTGAQRPLAEIRTDARRNLVDSVEVATKPFPGVMVCFDGLLLRGTRAIKVDVGSYRAFDTPDGVHLARLGTGIDWRVSPPSENVPFRVCPSFCQDVDVVALHPSLCPDRLRRRLSDPSLRGVVVVAFGVGVVPNNGVADVFGEAVRRGTDVVVITPNGGPIDLGKYRNSVALSRAGVIAGGRMTLPAATAKLMVALGRWPDDAERRRAYLGADVAGELARGSGA